MGLLPLLTSTLLTGDYSRRYNGYISLLWDTGDGGVMFKHNEIREAAGLAKAWFNDPFGLVMQFLAAYLEHENQIHPKK